MRLIQRLGSAEQYNDEYIDIFLKAHKEHAGSVDELWLATSYGFPPIEEHLENAKKLGLTAKRVRESGVAVSLQLSNSIGHGQYMSSCDCSGLVCEGGADPIVGEDGTISRYCFCWHGEKFRKYLLTEIEAYVSSVRPDCLWIDDDYRADNHIPVHHACFCDSCIARFNERTGKGYTRQVLVDEILHEKSHATRLEWISFVQDGLSELMREICMTVHKVSPETDIGLQNAWHGYTGYGLSFLYDTIFDVIGRPPLARPGGGAYNDHDPNHIINKMGDIEYQNISMPDYVECIAPEIENLPFNYSGKSAAGTAFETSVYLACGSTDMTYSMLMETNEPAEFYSSYFKLFSSHRAYWEKLSEVSKKSRATGISVAVAKEFFKRDVGEDDGIKAFAEERFSGTKILLRTGLPLTFAHKNEPILLHPEACAAMSRDELCALMKENVITDGESMEIMKSRGFFEDIELQGVAYSDMLKLRERYTAHTLTSGLYSDRFAPSTMTDGKNDTYTFKKLPQNAEILGIFENTAALENFFTGDYPFGIASFVFKTKEGGSFAVFGHGLWKENIPSSRLELLLRTADHISHEKLCAETLTHAQIMLKPRVALDDARTLSVSAVNLTIGAIEGLTLRVRGATGKPYLMGQYETARELEATQTDDGILLTIPTIAPYSVATVFFE